jgi:ABC-type Fe2+-enterobactin transport system substrate-binding protein
MKMKIQMMHLQCLLLGQSFLFLLKSVELKDLPGMSTGVDRMIQDQFPIHRLQMRPRTGVMTHNTLTMLFLSLIPAPVVVSTTRTILPHHPW